MVKLNKGSYSDPISERNKPKDKKLKICELQQESWSDKQACRANCTVWNRESDDDNGDDDCRCHGSSNSLKYMLFENPLIESA